MGEVNVETGEINWQGNNGNLFSVAPGGGRGEDEDYF